MLLDAGWTIQNFRELDLAAKSVARLLNELQDEMERAGHRPGRFKFIAAYNKRQLRHTN